jgi:hypothetical protein
MEDKILNLISNLEGLQTDAKGIEEYNTYQYCIDELYIILQK